MRVVRQKQRLELEKLCVIVANKGRFVQTEGEPL